MVASATSTACRDEEPERILDSIRAGKWAKEIAAVRLALASDGKEVADGKKKRLPAVLWTGTFSRRANDGLKAHAGFLCADLDAIGERVGELHDALHADPHAAAAFVSPSGTGLKVVFRVATDAALHAASFNAVRTRLREVYGVAVDEKAKDVARLCFVSHDPAAWWKSDAVPLEPLAEVKAPAPTAHRRNGDSLPPSAEKLLADGAPQGHRNAAAFDLACQCRDAGKSQGEAEATLCAFAGRCNPPLPEAEARAAVRSAYRTAPRPPARGNGSTAWTPIVATPDAADIRGKIIELLTDEDLSAAEQRRRIAEEVVAALAARGRFFFHADLRDFDSAMFFDNERKRLERIRCHAFNAWLSEWLRVNRADALFKFITAAVETAALSSPHTRAILPEAFWAARPGAVYLSNGDGQLVKITAQGVALADNGSDGILFASGRTLAPWQLCEPQDPFALALFATVNCLAPHGQDLLRLWLYSLPTSPRSKPPLCLAGEVGSGKTRTAKGMAELYGLPFIASKVEEAGEDDFWPGLDAGGLFTLDNADTRCKWLADALAAAATDGCSQRRKLYTNAENVILRARAWLAVTSASPSFAADAGLADRLLVVRLGRREGTTSDAALSDEITAGRDAGLSHIAQTLASALADTAPTPGDLNARHPDFAAFAVRIGRALGREAEAVAALRAAEADKSAFCLENDSIGAALLAFIRNAGHFTGTASELAQRLQEVDPDLKDRLSAKRLGKRLSALWPHVGKAFAVARKELGRTGITVFEFRAAQDAGFAGFQTAFS